MSITIEDLKAQRRWVLWRLENRDGKDTKVPYQINGRKAASTRPDEWVPFAEASANVEGFTGVGLMTGTLDGVHVSGTDIDHCANTETGEFDPKALELMRGLDSYTEYSPSGTGCHTLVIGTLQGRKGLKLPFNGLDAVELYDQARFFTFTGRHIPGTPDAIQEREDAFNGLYDRVRASKPPTAGILVRVSPSEEERLARLMAGDMSDHNDDHSAADFALCCLLAKRHGCNAFKINAEFEKSGLYREKWDRDDYRENTITRAILAVSRDAELREAVTKAEAEAEADAEPRDWRELFHSKDDVLNCSPPTFLIENFLACQAICAIAAPVGQRKSIIALNMARSLCTGEPLFGFLPVITRPSRVLYLCPEMGLVSLSERVRKIGVGDCLGDTLFLRSMNLGSLDLMDLPDEALEGSVLIVDTAIRFMQGDENSSKDMKAFSDILFSLQRRQGPKGAIVVLYHSPKTTKDVFELTLENCLRGSGELGAAVTDAHGTRMQNPEDRWGSENFISHVKCRDYEGVEDFAVSCDRATSVLVRTGKVGVKAVLSVKKGGQKADADGMDEAARAFIKARPDLTVTALIAGLAESGIERKKTWVTDARLAMRGGGSKLTSG